MTHEILPARRLRLRAGEYAPARLGLLFILGLATARPAPNHPARMVRG